MGSWGRCRQGCQDITCIFWSNETPQAKREGHDKTLGRHFEDNTPYLPSHSQALHKHVSQRYTVLLLLSSKSRL